MKRFTYTTTRRFCPDCGGDGFGLVFSWTSCRRCGGSGQLAEPHPPGETHIELTHDQSGRVTDTRVVPGTDPPMPAFPSVSAVVALMILAFLASAYYFWE